MIKYTIIHNTTTISDGIEYTKVTQDFNDGHVFEVKKRRAEMEMMVALKNIAGKYNVPESEMDTLLIKIEAEQKDKALAVIKSFHNNV